VLTDLTLESEVVVVVTRVVGETVLIVEVDDEDEVVAFEVVDGGVEVELEGVAVTVTVVTTVTVVYGHTGTLREGLPTRLCLGT
jgi:hypothetical protein